MNGEFTDTFVRREFAHIFKFKAMQTLTEHSYVPLFLEPVVKDVIAAASGFELVR